MKPTTDPDNRSSGWERGQSGHTHQDLTFSALSGALDLDPRHVKRERLDRITNRVLREKIAAAIVNAGCAGNNPTECHGPLAHTIEWMPTRCRIDRQCRTDGSHRRENRGVTRPSAVRRHGNNGHTCSHCNEHRDGDHLTIRSTCLDNTWFIVEAFRPSRHPPCHRRTDGHCHGCAECQRPPLARDGHMDEELHGSTVVPPENAP